MLRNLLRDPDQVWNWLVTLSVFGLVLALWYAVVTVWYLRRSRHRDQLRHRLGLEGGSMRDGVDAATDRVLRLWHDGELVETFVPHRGARSLFQWLEQVRQDAGWKTPMARVLLMLAVVCAICFVVCFVLLHNMMLAVALPVAIILGFRIYVLRCLKTQTEFFEKQLIEALDLGARSLRAGHPLSGAFRLMSEEMDPPVGTMFAEICEQESLGLSVQDALRAAADRSRSSDMRIFAASVIIQLRSGGNLADMMERVAWVVRERMRLHRRARVLTAEAQLSKWVLIGLPIVLFIILNILNAKYMKPFFEEFAGQMMMLAAVALMLVGGWIMGRMAKLKY